jgi:serine/threonine protein kinase/CRP-like cAMP-binding protein
MGCSASVPTNTLDLDKMKSVPSSHGAKADTMRPTSPPEPTGTSATIPPTTFSGSHPFTDGTTESLASTLADSTLHDPLSRPMSLLRDGAHHLRNVFAAPLSFVKKAQQFTKTPKDCDFLRINLRKNYLFESIPDSEMTKLITSFEKLVVTADDESAIEGENGTTLVHLIHQGESVDKDTAYFYVVYLGKCMFSVNGKTVGWAKPGDFFGELSLLYDCPRAATVTAVVDAADNVSPQSSSSGDLLKGGVVLFRVHQRDFRAVLQHADQAAYCSKMNLLEGVLFLKNVSIQDKEKLASVMRPIRFQKGDYLLHKGEAGCSWTIIERGVVKAMNISINDEVASHHFYQDITLKDGECFGERSIVTGEATIADVVADSDGVAFTVDKDTFQEVLGNLQELVLRSMDHLRLKGIPILSHSAQTDGRVLSFLSTKVVDVHFPAGTILCSEGQPLQHPAALYLVRKGMIEIDTTGESNTEFVITDGYFGDDQLLADTKEYRGKYIAPYTAMVTEDCTCGVLKLIDCRKVLNTRQMGRVDHRFRFDSLVAAQESTPPVPLKLDDFSFLQMVGSGTFGQCFLVSRQCSDGTPRTYALKVQSKYELCQAGQAKSVVREKNMMTTFHNPFVSSLVAAFQDDGFVYILMHIYQGGELYNIMHTKTSNVISEADAKFYAACIAEALRYLHCSHGLVYRDLKPENVMIDDDGYAVLIDFGFCKKIAALKTYTMCGTPLYLAPEVILNRGHSWSVDHWSLGILIYEMLEGHTPFYKSKRNKSEVFRAIVKEKVLPPENVSPEGLSLLSGLLKRDPTKRLGSLAGGEAGILEHSWFSDIDLDLLFFKEIKAPFVPSVKDSFDISNFEDWSKVEDKRKKKYPKLSEEEAEIFNDF